MAQYLVEAYTPKRVRDDLPTLVARARKESTDKRPRSGSERKGNIMRRLLIGASALAVAVAYFVLSALPAFSADTGNVSAQVTVATPCITVTPTTPVDFGTQPFDAVTSGVDVGFSNCSGTTEKVFVRGTDATGSGGASWSLSGVSVDSSPCPTLNSYGLGLGWSGGGGTLTVSTADQPATDSASGSNTYAANTGASYTPVLRTPCAGSDGAGQTMSWVMVFTATF